VFIINPNSGEITVSTNISNEGNSDVLKDDYLDVKNDDILLSEITFSDYYNEHILTFYSPVHNEENQLIGIIVAYFNMKALDEILVDISSVPELTETYLVNNTNHIVAGAGYTLSSFEKKLDINKLLQEPINTIGLTDARKGISQYDIYTDYRGKTVVGYYDILDSLNLVIFTEQDYDRAFEPIDTLTSRLILFLSISLLLIVLVAYLSAYETIKPIKLLTKIADKISSGNLKIRSELKRGDEIGQLSNSFNKMADSLLESLDETKKIFQTMPNAICILDTNGNVLNTNNASTELSGYSREEIIGKYWFDSIQLPGIENKNKSKKITPSDIFQDRDTVSANGICIHKNKRKSRINISGSILKDDKGQVDGYIMIIKDLSELNRYAKEKIDAILPILNRISLGDFSKAIEIPSAEDEFTDLLVSVDLMSDNLQELIKQNKKKTEEIKTSQGKLKISNVILKKAKEKIEEEKAKAESLLSSLGEGIIAFDLKGNVVMMNPEAEKIFNKRFATIFKAPNDESSNFEDKNGNPIYIGSHPISGVIKSKKQVYINTYYLKDGAKPLPLGTTFSPILFQRKLLGIIATFRDVTKEIEIDKAKTEFVSLASHQLRTPMTGVKWLIQAAMMKGDLNANQKDLLKDALASNERMIGLVNDLLNVSRLEAGIIGRKPEEVDVTKFVEVLVKEARFTAKQKKQTIKLIKPKKLLKASLDPQLVGQIINSLLSNAMRYSGEGKVVIVSTKARKTNFDIIVTDQGIGITNADQKKLFTRFFRTKEAMKIDTSGSGLGLYIIKRVSEVCNGKIKCQSKLEKGTTFTITLPYKILKKEGVQSLIEHMS
ncbi:PAS domain S-box protein, partial [Patescibacteria group bacterium]|nr:PAS domain S-box protein [Patescibacteria group bacterium]